MNFYKFTIGGEGRSLRGGLPWPIISAADAIQVE